MKRKNMWFKANFWGILVFGFMSIIFLFPSFSFAAPKLFFSDLESGPKTGWEGSATKGAAVTVWGKGFGSTRGSSYVTVNGTQLTSNSDYAEWGTISTANGIPRGLERITFWLNNNCQDGSGTIAITVNGKTSNTLPFTVRNGNIYFISVTLGSDSNNGRYSTKQIGAKGPWKRMLMVAPNNNAVLRPGDIIYVRGGTYTEEDKQDMLVHFKGDSGTADMPYATIGYPGEIPILDLTNAGYGGFYMERTPTSYWVFSKFKFSNGSDGFNIWGSNKRVIGNHFTNMNRKSRSGEIMVWVSEHVKIYGNYFERSGYDMYKHNIYIATTTGKAVGNMTEAKYIDIGWNEFDRWTADLNQDSHTKPSRGGCIEIKTVSDAYALGRRTNNIYIHDNYFHDGDSQALYVHDTNVLIVYNNIFANISSKEGGFRIGPNIDSTSLFYNNVFYHVASSSAPMIYFRPSATPYWKNNIFYAYSGQSYATVESGSQFNSENDLFYGNGSPSGSNYNITNAVIEPPKFILAPTDFHLQSTSPARDKGTSTTAPIVTHDYDGIVRPQRLSYDIGAYEYVEE